jgi:hypothetical protein
MRFHIEITRADGANTVVILRTSVDEMSPFRARVKAASLVSLYASRGANSARVLNDKNEESINSRTPAYPTS